MVNLSILRRLLVQFFRRAFVLVFLLVLGCAAQSPTPSLEVAIEHQVRSYYNLPPNVQVQIGPRHASEFPNYDAFTVTLAQGERKQNVDLLVSKDGKSLIHLTKLDLSKDPYAENMRKIKTQGRPMRGNPDAKVTVISYDDFQCPFCSRMHQELFRQVLGDYAGRVKVIYKDFPLPMHPWAIHAAVNANCLVAQNNDAYWDMADYVHANQASINGPSGSAQPVNQPFAALDKIALDIGQRRQLDMSSLQACITAQKDDAVQQSLREAADLGVDATPTLFVNGEKIDGALPAAQLRSVLDRALKESGVPAPIPTAPSAVKPAASPGR